ncbi:hypothetical protein C2857_002465 [Epichloe festucae Fl1]|uniref:Uncharacterized protein n=1 Tax=Epichloe festucae (strain Fl1) TaxID=877507 RepID=A0A7S9PWR7_EPIFF|nr:hypothetical protein C2857_002465 [Epichloe festucae Fl1]
MKLPSSPVVPWRGKSDGDTSKYKYPAILAGAAVMMVVGWPLILWTEMIVQRNHVESDTDIVAIWLFVAQVVAMILPSFDGLEARKLTGSFLQEDVSFSERTRDPSVLVLSMMCLRDPQVVVVVVVVVTPVVYQENMQDIVPHYFQGQECFATPREANA